MPKNALFFEKAVKITSALGAPPLPSVGNCRLRIPFTDPRMVLIPTITNFFSAHL